MPTIASRWSLAVSIAFGLSLAVEIASAQRVHTTGTRTGSTTTARTIIQLGGDSAEAGRVRRLLEDGQVEEAVAAAEAYIASLDNTVYVGAGSAAQERSVAFNALCAALTHTGQTDRALDACNEAVRLMPSRWPAVNNRGTAHYLAQRYDLALVDYRRALELATSRNVAAMVEHNIGLAEQRLADGNAAP